MVFSSPIFLFFFLPRYLFGLPPFAGDKKPEYLAGFSQSGLFCFWPASLSDFINPQCDSELLLRPLASAEGRLPPAGLGAGGNSQSFRAGRLQIFGFLLATLNSLTGAELPLAGIVLPIGISFYTFQGLSYLIDVYREPEKGTKSFGKLLLYIVFFPQLIAGPIVIYHDISQQIDQREQTPELTLSGLERFIGGLAKKLLLADTAARIADGVFAMTAGELDARLAWLGAICYTLQIYFDFSGYSDMAIGLGRLFGFRFLENFNLPYTARSIKEFWRRWHISLSSWFKNYLYIPLGGNRRGRRRTACNKLIVFFVTGLWHGANWTFVLWGLWHGLFSSLEDLGFIPRRLRESGWGHLYTMLVVVLGFTLFRAESLESAALILSQMFTGFDFTPEHTLALIALLNGRTLFLLACALLLAAGLPQRLWRRLEESTLPAGLRSAMAGALYAGIFAVSVLNLVSTTFSPFIYFQF